MKLCKRCLFITAALFFSAAAVWAGVYYRAALAEFFRSIGTFF